MAAEYLIAFKSALDIIKSLKDLVVSTEGKAKVAELYEKLLEAQQAAATSFERQSVLQERLSKLEIQLREIRAWNSTKERYALIEAFPRSGLFVYALKGKSASSEPAHWICPSCYEQGNKSVLQRERVRVGRETYMTCPACNTRLDVTGYPESNAVYV